MPVDTSQLVALFLEAKTDSERGGACREIVEEICRVYDNPNTRLAYLTRVRRELASVGIAKRFLDLIVLSEKDYQWRDAQHEGRQLKRQLFEIRMKLVPQQFLRNAIKALRHEDPVVRLLGVQALTGRRAVEIFERGRIRPSEFPGWAIFEGQAKTKGRANEGYLIPIAHPDGVEPVAKVWAEAALDLRRSGILSQRFPPRGKTPRSKVAATPLSRSLHELALTHVRAVFGLSKTTLLRSAYATYTHEWLGRPMQKVQWIAVVLGHRTDVAGVLVPDRETALNYDAWDIAPVPTPMFPSAPAMPPLSALVPGAGEIAAIVGTTSPPPRPVPIDDADEWESEGDDEENSANEEADEPRADEGQSDSHSQPPEAMPKPAPAPQAPVETPADPPQPPVPPPTAPAQVAPAQPAPQSAKVPPTRSDAPAVPAAATTSIPEQPQAARNALAEIAAQVETARRKADSFESTATKLSGEIAALTERLELVRAEARASREGAERLSQALDVIAKFLPGGGDPTPALPTAPAPAAVPASGPAPAVAPAPAPPAAATVVEAAGAAVPAPAAPAPPAAPATLGRVRGSRKGKDNQVTVLKRLLEAGPVKRQDLFSAMGDGVTEGSFRVLLSRLTKKGEIARVVKAGVPWFELRTAQ